VKDAAEYLAQIKVLIISNPHINGWTIMREESQGDIGLLRYQLDLQDRGFLEIFERFEIRSGEPIITKYSYHWQDASGNLKKRWDNAAHHPEIVTHPHHVHIEQDENVAPHNAIKLADILNLILV
jgi:hypothetical protein